MGIKTDLTTYFGDNENLIYVTTSVNLIGAQVNKIEQFLVEIKNGNTSHLDMAIQLCEIIKDSLK